MDGLAAYIAAVLSDLAGTWPFLLAIGIFLSSLIGSWVIHVLKDDESFEIIRDWVLKPGMGARYTDLITYGLDAAMRFYGPNPWLSLRGYVTCLFIALAYPIFLLQLAWVLDGPTTIGGESAFDETAQIYQRWISLFALWLFVIFSIFLFRRADQLRSFIKQFLRRHDRYIVIPGAELKTVPRAAVAVGAAVAVVAAVAGGAVSAVVAVVAVVAGGAGGAVSAGVAIVAVVAVVAVGADGAVVAVVAVVAVSVAVLAVAVGAVGAVGTGGTVIAVFYLTMFICVPAANAALDHISVQVSRWLLTDLVDRRGTARKNLMMLGHVVADVIFAVIFLVMLAILLPMVLQLTNRAFDAAGWPVVEWGPYLDAARRDPFGAGLLVTGMLATTLIPTILHMLAAGGAFLLPIIGGNLIEELATKPEPTLLDRIGFAVLTVSSILLSWAMLAVLAIAIWEAVAAFGLPLGSNLADLAETIGRAVGGPGAPN
jgi:hypothetical protein